MTDSIKRYSDSSEASLAKKRKPLDELSEEGPLTQEDVTYFQKEAIWRQMTVYKRQCNILSRDLRSFKHKYEANEAKLNTLDLWYEQIINLLTASSKFHQEDVNESLLLKITHHSDKDKLEDILTKRRTHLLAILTPILENSKISYPDSKELLQKFEQLNQDLCQLKAENETISTIKAGLEEQLEKSQEKLLALVREKERQNSKTLGRVDISLVKKEASENGTSEASKDTKGAASNSAATESKESNGAKEDEKSSEISSAEKELLETLQITVKELESSNATLQHQLSELSKKHQKSSEDCLELASRLSSLSPKDLNISPIYQNIVSQNKKLSEQVEELIKIQNVQVIKINELENSKGEVKKFVDESVNGEVESLKELLSKCESDLVRIRTSRDELISKNTILKSEVENKNLVQELKKLVAVQKEKIDSLTSSKESATSDEDLAKVQALSSDDLIKRVNMLNGEIKEIEKVFQSTHEIAVNKLHNEAENENLIKKLTVEKTKADQKYFAAMRSKDAIVSENKILKSQIAKSQELINKLNETEKVYLTKISILQKSEIDFKTIKENSLQENSKLQEQIKSVHATKDKLEQELKALKKTFESTLSKANEAETLKDEATNKLAKIEAKVKELEILLKKYRNNNTSSILQDDEKQLEALRSIAKCSLCSKNWKDTAITVCGHVFCSDCAQERLAARLRRCPSCNKGFSANDLLAIHL